MKKYLIGTVFLALANCVFGQFSDEDTAIMSKAINHFRSSLNTNYLIIKKSYDNEYRERPEFVRAALSKLNTIKKIPSNSKLEIIKATKTFKKYELPDFDHATKVEIYSDEIDFLCSIHDVTAANAGDITTSKQENLTSKEKAEKEKLKMYKDYYRLEEMKALEISEPFYDSVMTNAIVILTVYKYGVADTDLLLFKKEKGIWKMTDSWLALSNKF